MNKKMIRFNEFVAYEIWIPYRDYLYALILFSLVFFGLFQIIR